jgi:predicted phosphodiesterase
VNKQKKVLFKKIVPDITLDIIKEQYELMGNKNKYAPIIRKNDSKKKPVMYEIALFDMHLGKLAYSAETGESYDLKIAEELYMNAIYDLLAKASHLNIEKILFPVGQDLINSDGMIPETTAGTRQDNDSRYTKIYTTVSRILVSTIDMLRKCADVDIVIVPSNHDYASMFYIGEFLSAWYRNDKHVDVNNAPTQRKYYRYGKTLIGFTHGDQEKHDKLPLLMAREAQEDWAKVDFMQWHIGHLHKRRVTKYTDGDTFNGVEVRVLPSLSASDFWHTQKGYVKGNRMATGFVFDKEEGCVAEFLSKYIKDKK